MMKPTDPRTVIIGGGITGASLALKLAYAKRPVTLIDARAALTSSDWEDKLKRRDARVYALSLASIELFKALGVWEKIVATDRKADYSQMLVWQQDGMGSLTFGDESQAIPKLLGSMIEPVVIELAIWQRLSEADISEYVTVIRGQKVTHLDWRGSQSGYQVTLDNGKRIDGKLVVGADGRGSFVRHQASIGTESLDYHQTAICCAIKTQLPHKATARQVMLPTGTLALLPLADIFDEDKARPQHWQSVVWTLPTNQALDMLDRSEDEIAESLAVACGFELGEIQHIESIASFALTAQQADTYVRDNLALIGDAAHGVHPLAGQGLNLGLLDVTTLADTLMTDWERSAGNSWAALSTLRRYERRRRPHNSLMMHSFSLINWLFASDLAKLRAVQQIRNEGMYRVGKSQPLMRLFAQQASGL